MLSGLAGQGAKLSILSDCLLPSFVFISTPPKLPRRDKRGVKDKAIEEEGTSVCVVPELALPAFTHLPR